MQMPRESHQSSLHRPSDVQDRLANAMHLFTTKYGRQPTVAALAPGRINLIGEHTDYNDGFVLPMAIDRFTVIVADAHAGDASHLFSASLDQDHIVDLRAPLPPLRGQWVNYLLGVADQFMRQGHRLCNMDALITSDIPIGAGLSSSAALEVAFALMLNHLLNARLVPMDIALLCQRAEHAFPGTPCGIMDMLTATHARADHAMLIDCRSNDIQYLPMPPVESVTVLVMNTGVRHELADSAYADRRRTCEAAARILGLPSLRDATVAMARDERLSAMHRRRVLHVVAENTRTVLAAQALASGDMKTLGALMFASHESLRDLYGVSCDELNVVVEAAREMQGRGIFGARMTGGGFGGCAIALCRTDAVDAVRAHITRKYLALCGQPCDIFPVRASSHAVLASM